MSTLPESDYTHFLSRDHIVNLETKQTGTIFASLDKHHLIVEYNTDTPDTVDTAIAHPNALRINSRATPEQRQSMYQHRLDRLEQLAHQFETLQFVSDNPSQTRAIEKLRDALDELTETRDTPPKKRTTLNISDDR